MALTLGILIATFDVLSKGEHFFVPLVMAVLAVYLVDIVSRFIRKILIAQHSVPNAISVILAFGIIFGLGFVLFEIVAQNARHVAAAAPKYQARLQQLQGEIFSRVGIEEPPELRQLLKTFDLRSVFTAVAKEVASALEDVTLVLIYGLFIMLERRFGPIKVQALFPDPGTPQKRDPDHAADRSRHSYLPWGENSGELYQRSVGLHFDADCRFGFRGVLGSAHFRFTLYTDHWGHFRDDYSHPSGSGAIRRSRPMSGHWNWHYRDCPADGKCRGTECHGRNAEPEPSDSDHLLNHLGLDLGDRRGLSLRPAHRDSGNCPFQLPRHPLGLHSSIKDRRNTFLGVDAWEDKYRVRFTLAQRANEKTGRFSDRRWHQATGLLEGLSGDEMAALLRMEFGPWLALMLVMSGGYRTARFFCAPRFDDFRRCFHQMQIAVAWRISFAPDSPELQLRFGEHGDCRGRTT